MNNRERFLNTLNFKKVEDRIPMIEWASWWDKTLNRWESEGLEFARLKEEEIRELFGLDAVRQFWIRPTKISYPHVEYGIGVIESMEEYEAIKEHLFPEDPFSNCRNQLLDLKEKHDRGEVVVWLTLDGFFWHPRRLFGIENHLYAFYDYPELMHRINQDLSEYCIRVIEQFCNILEPDFMTFAEDMSYNNGPMLSKDNFDEFIRPYYLKVVPELKKHNIIPFVDTDGNLEKMVSWLLEAGIEGVLPLERQSGVDVQRLRQNYPELKMLGAFDKMVMSKGEGEIQREFERILPVLKTGGFIPSCDHQTPPEVSLENYKIYLRLLREYCEKAVK